MVSHGSPKPLSWVRFPPPLPQKSLLISAANIESGIRVVERIVADLGYKGVTLADLALSEDETGKIDYIKRCQSMGYFLLGNTRGSHAREGNCSPDGKRRLCCRNILPRILRGSW